MRLFNYSPNLPLAAPGVLYSAASAQQAEKAKPTMPDSLMKREGPDGQIWIEVAVAHGEAQAAIIAGMLESAGVPVLVYRESAGLALPVSFGRLGEVTIMTLEKYYDEALALLEGDDDTPLIDLEGDDDSTVIFED